MNGYAIINLRARFTGKYDRLWEPQRWKPGKVKHAGLGRTKSLLKELKKIPHTITKITWSTWRIEWE